MFIDYKIKMYKIIWKYSNADGWSDWSMWNEERTKSQGHIFAGETSAILKSKEIQGSLRYKVTNSDRGEYVKNQTSTNTAGLEHKQKSTCYC